MASTLEYWEPDYKNILIKPDIGMAHLMRFDLPESHQERLPYENDEFIFTGDCRIDNRQELASELQLSPNDRDSLFVINAYQKWGETCCEHLIGDFSFVIWDKKQELAFCGRDHIGIKPFYYYQTPLFFAFSTEIKALFCIPEIQKKWNIDHLNIIFTQEVMHSAPYSDHTLFENIFQLTPGHTLTVSLNNVQKNRYWHPENLQPLQLSEEELLSQLNALLAQAVHCRLRSPNNVACELSGGLDSSLITAIAKKTHPDLHTITQIPPAAPSPFLNEIPFANEVCTFLGIQNIHAVNDKNYSPEESLKATTHCLDGPDYGLCIMYKEPIEKKAKSLNCSVILSGFGGDECLSATGNVYNIELAKTYRWKTLFSRLNYSQPKSIKNILKTSKNTLSLIIKTHTPKRLNSYTLKIPTKLIQSYYKKPLKGKFEKYQNTYRSEINIQSLKGCNALILQTLTGHNPNHSHHVRKILNAHAIAIKNVTYRFPLLDVRLIEFILRIPPEQRYPAGSHRYLIRKAMENLLPTTITQRKDKAGSIHPSTFYQCLKYFEKETQTTISYLSSTGEKSKTPTKKAILERLHYDTFMLEKAYNIAMSN